MKIIAPAYYADFKCVAASCRNSCCVGWEIDIDGETLDLYGKMTHPYARNIRESIDRSGEPHFRLGAGERCPHLAASGLCNIITECGEQTLCQICRDHPRYRNFYDGVTELGLGLSCEEAARLALSGRRGFIVSDTEDMTDTEYVDEYPKELFSGDDSLVVEEKSALLAIAADSTEGVEKRLSRLLPKMPSLDEIKELFLSLEILDDTWTERISRLSAEDFRLDFEKYGDLIECTIVALLFRHLTAESFYSPTVTAAFAALSSLVVAALSGTPEGFADTLRAFSAEVEYSTENTERILDFIEERIQYEI